MTGTQETDNPAGLYLLQANLILKSLSCTISFHRDTPFLFTRDSPGTPYSTSSCRCSPLLLLLPGAREPGGGKGVNCPPPNFLSQWDGYACAPPKIWQSLGMSTLLPPPPRKKSFPRPWLLRSCCYDDGYYLRFLSLLLCLRLRRSLLPLLCLLTTVIVTFAAIKHYCLTI